MKKFLVVAFLSLAMGLSVSAQSHKALGIRGGLAGGQLSYESYASVFGGDFLEADFGFFATPETGLVTLDALTNNIFWSYSGVNAYWGYGVRGGLGIGKEIFQINAMALGQVGVEYSFEAVPLQLSLDYRPGVGLALGTVTRIATDFSGLCLSVRFAF